MRRSSHKKISKNLSRGVKVTRPSFSVENEDKKRGIYVYTGEEARSRSRQTLSSDKYHNGSASKIESFSPNSNLRNRNSRIRTSNQPLSYSREIKVKVRQSRPEIGKKPIHSSRNMLSSMGEYLENRIPKKEITRQNPKKVNITGMINPRESQKRSTTRFARSIHKEVSSRMASRSGSSLKHEIKIRSISRSRNFLNLDEYCNKIERESRFNSTSMDNRESRKHQNKIKTLVKNLKKLKEKPVEKTLNSDYYSLGKGRPRGRNPPREVKKSWGIQRTGISESQLRNIRKMFPFNQVWFWDLSTEKQHHRIKQNNSDLLRKLKIPVQVLISKVKQSDHITDSKIISPKHHDVQTKRGFFQKRGEVEVKGQRPPECKILNDVPIGQDEEDQDFGEFKKNERFQVNHGYDDEEIEEMEEMKGGHIGGGKKEFSDNNFGHINFKNKKKESRFNNIGYKDQKHFQQKMKTSHQPEIIQCTQAQNPGNYSNNNVYQKNNYRDERYNYSRNFGQRSNRVIVGAQQNEKRPKNGTRTNPYQSSRNIRNNGSSLRERNQVKIRNKTRDYKEKNFIHVNKKVIMGKNNSRNNYYPKRANNIDTQRNKSREQGRIVRNGNKYSNFSNHRQNEQSSKRIYLDNIKINRNSKESDDFDDDYFEEKNKIQVENNRQNHANYVSRNRNPGNGRFNKTIQAKKRNQISPEKIYIENLNINKDSESEDYGDEYFEEKGIKKQESKKKYAKNYQSGSKIDRKQNINVGRRPVQQNLQNSSEEVYHEMVDIQRSSKDITEDHMDDDYFEERNSHGWKNQPKIHLNKKSQNSEIKKNYFKNGQRVNHNRQDSPERTFVETIEIQNNEEDEDFNDDYFEERESHDWKNKKDDNQNNHNNQNVFVNSGVSASSKFRSFAPNSKNNSNISYNERFESFAPKNKTISKDAINDRFNSFGPNMNHRNNTCTYTVQVESRNDMPENEIQTNRETKGEEVYYKSGSKQNRSEKKTNYTSSTYNSSKNNTNNFKQEKRINFNNPYHAQIFTDQKTYTESNSKRYNSRNMNSNSKNTYSDYYQRSQKRF